MSNFDYKNMTPFKWFVLENFPFIENDFEEINNYRLFSKVVEYLNKTIDNVNVLGNLVEQFSDYFDNLDVQEEINNKLDEMAKNGKLQALLTEQYEELKNNVNEQINTFENSVNNTISYMNTALQNITSGTPLIVSNTSDMLDTSRIYVNTTDGNWYYYNGTQWTIGGVYQSSGIADKSIDILMLKDNLQANFSTQFSNDIDKGEGFEGGCRGSVGAEITIDTTVGSSYKYYIVNLDVGDIYTYSGKQPSGLKALIITDSNNIVKYVAPSDASGAVVSATFSVNESGMKAYISRYMQSTTGNNVQYYKFENAFRLRKLTSISNNLKFDSEIKLLQEIDNIMLPAQTINNDLIINNIENVFVNVYPMEKGKHYKTKSRHYSYSRAYVITDSKYKVLSQDDTPSGGTQDIVNEFTAEQDGYIFLSTNNKTTAPVEIEIIPTFEVISNEYSNIKNKTIVYDGDSICESRLTGNAQNGGSFPVLIANKTNSNYVNQAVGGGHLAHWTQTDRHCVVDNLSNLPTNADLYVFCAGINDFWGNAEIGITTPDYTTEVDDTTIKGSMEKIFRYCLNNMPTSKVLFIIEHKIQNTSFIQNDNNNTFTDYHDAMVEICNKYSIPYYDAFNNSNLNGWNSYQSNTYLNANSTQTADGCHPNEEGYKQFYVPQLIEIYKSILKRED